MGPKGTRSPAAAREARRAHRAQGGVRGRHAARVHKGRQVPHARLVAPRKYLLGQALRQATPQPVSILG